MPNSASPRSPGPAGQEPGRPSNLSPTGGKNSPKDELHREISRENSANKDYANPPTGVGNANLAVARGDVTSGLPPATSSNGAARALRNWADCPEDQGPGADDDFTVVRTKKRRRESANSPTAAAPSSNIGGARTSRRPQSSAGSVPRAQEVRTTRAHITEARARQASSSEDHCVYLEHGPELQPFHYLRALDRMLGGTAGVIQVSKVNGHQLLGLANRGLAERLINEGLEVEGTLLRAFPFRKRAERITVGNLPFFVEDSAIISALKPYGRVTSIAPKLMKAGPYTYNDGRREAFIVLREGMTIERLPTRLEIPIKGEAWPAYLSSGIKCSMCHGQGHRRANCPLLAGRANNSRLAPPTSPAGVPSTTTSAPPQRTSAIYTSGLGRTYGDGAPAPPPVTPAPSLRAPGSHEPAAPTPDIEMSIIEETSTSSTSSSKTSTREGLVTFIERNAGISFAQTDALGLGREEVLDILSSKTKARKRGSLLSPSQCGALAGLIRQLLGQRPGGDSNIYKVLRQVLSELRTAPTAVPSTPPLPAPRPSGPTPPTSHSEELMPAVMTPPPPAPTEMEEDNPMTEKERCAPPPPAPRLAEPTPPTPHGEELTPAMATPPPPLPFLTQVELETKCVDRIFDLFKEQNYQQALGTLLKKGLDIDNLSHSIVWLKTQTRPIRPRGVGETPRWQRWIPTTATPSSRETGRGASAHRHLSTLQGNQQAWRAAQPTAAEAANRTRTVQPREIKATRANIAEAKARQTSSSHENYIFVELCPGIPDYSYLQAMGKVVGGPVGITQFNRMNGHYIVGLATRDLARRLIEGGLEIEGTTLRVFPYRKRAERIVVANLPGFVEDKAVVDALRPFGNTTSIAPILFRMGEYTFTDGRREAFVLLHDGITLEMLPTRLDIKSRGDNLPAYLSFGNKCAKCGKQGHRRANGPALARQTISSRQTPSPTDAKPSSPPPPPHPQQPRQPSPAPAAPASPVPPAETSTEATAIPSAPQPAEPKDHAQPAPAAHPAPLVPPRPPGARTPLLDCEMTNEEEFSTSSTSSQKRTGRAQIEKHLDGLPTLPIVQSVLQDLGRAKTLDLLSSRKRPKKDVASLQAAQVASLLELTNTILAAYPDTDSTVQRVLSWETNAFHLDSRQDLCLGYNTVVLTHHVVIPGSGLACVLRPGVAVLRQRVLWPGHIALAVIDVHGKEMTIINAHLAHDPRERLEQLELLAATAIQEGAWVPGDLNIREPSSSSADALAALLDLAALVDVATQFDAAHLPTRVASRGDQIESSRLDRILVPAGVLDRVTIYATSHYHLSDHHLVLLQVGPPAVFSLQPRLAATLRSGLALEHLAGYIRELEEELAHDDDDEILLWDRWTTIKAGLLAEARSLHDPRHAASDGYVVRARGYIAAQLEASSIRADYPSLPDLARAIHLRRPVSVIRDDDDYVIEGPELRRKAYAIFQPRFARPTSDPAAGAAFIGNSMITPISDLGEEDPLHRPEICLSEIAAAIRRLPRGKAPGWDGLPCELLAAFEDFFAEALARVFAASRLRGALPPSTRRSYICLVPKARGGRGLEGYRPIALPSADYRVLAAILHRRLKPHLRALVPDCQTYAVPGRSPSWNIAKHRYGAAATSPGVDPRRGQRHRLRRRPRPPYPSRRRIRAGGDRPRRLQAGLRYHRQPREERGPLVRRLAQPLRLPSWRLLVDHLHQGPRARHRPQELRSPSGAASSRPPGVRLPQMDALHPRPIPRRASQSGEFAGGLHHPASPARVPAITPDHRQAAGLTSEVRLGARAHGVASRRRHGEARCHRRPRPPRPGNPTPARLPQGCAGRAPQRQERLRLARRQQQRGLDPPSARRHASTAPPSPAVEAVGGGLQDPEPQSPGGPHISAAGHPNHRENSANKDYANPPTGVGNANLAVARGDVTSGLPAATSSNGASRALRNCADCPEDQCPGAGDDFTVVKTKKRRRESSNSPTAAASSSSGGARRSRRMQSSARSVPRAQEIPTTRAHIAEARAHQASSAEEHCVYLEHGPELQPFHYLRALDRLLGGTAGVVQVSKLRSTPAAVPPTPPLPAPWPAETAPPAPQGEELAPAEVAYPPPLPVKMTDEARKKWLLDLFKELNCKTFLAPLLCWNRPEQIIHAALHSGEKWNDILKAHPNQRSILANFLGSVIERARSVWAGSPHRAEHEPGNLGSDNQAFAELSAETHFQEENSIIANASGNYANLPIDRKHANFAAACVADVTPSTSGALTAATNWAEQMEASETDEDGFTVVKHKRRRRESPSRSVEQRSSGVATSRITGPTPRRRPPACGATGVQMIKATRADIADARACQRSSTEDNCVFVEHCPDFGSTHYLQAVEELIGGAGNVLQVMKMDGHMLVGLSTKALAERLIRDGLDIGHTHLRAFPFKKRAERITVGNLPFFVDDAAVIEALKPYGDVTSIVPIRLRAGRYTFTDGRREAFILLKEGIALEKIPTRVIIRNKGNVLSAFISYGVKCSRCGRQGHRRANCPIIPGRASNNAQPQPAPPPSGASSTESRQLNRPTPTAPAPSPKRPAPQTSAPGTSAALPARTSSDAVAPFSEPMEIAAEVLAPSTSNSAPQAVKPMEAPEAPADLRPPASQPAGVVPQAQPASVAPPGPLHAHGTPVPPSPSSSGRKTRPDLEAYLKRNPGVSFAETDALGLGREEVLDILSSKTRAHKRGQHLTLPQSNALAGLIYQILDLRPGGDSNIYKVLRQVLSELRTAPTAVPSTPPLPAPRPAGPTPPVPHEEETRPTAMRPSPPLEPTIEDDMIVEIFTKLDHTTSLRPIYVAGINPVVLRNAVLYAEYGKPLMAKLTTALRKSAAQPPAPAPSDSAMEIPGAPPAARAVTPSTAPRPSPSVDPAVPMEMAPPAPPPVTPTPSLRAPGSHVPAALTPDIEMSNIDETSASSTSSTTKSTRDGLIAFIERNTGVSFARTDALGLGREEHAAGASASNLEDKRMVKMVRVNISDEKLVAMQKDTREDPALVKVIDYVIEGWPICKKDVDEDAKKKPHLLVVDRYSGYPELFTLDPPTAINVKNKLRETFARFGIPETMMSDNGPPFRSEIMTDFCIRWGIKQLFSSPHLHRSNGLAERNIQTIKNQLIKCRDEGSDPFLAILAYRNTPKNDLPSPAQLCLSRSLRCQIPRITPLYRPYQTNWRNIENAKRKRQSSMKEQYDRNSKSYPKVNVGEDAWCQIHPRETWTPVKISAQADSPQSFEVVTPSGNRLIRNQKFIRPRDGGYEKSQLSSEPITASPEAQHPQCDSPTMGESSTAPIQRSSEETNIDQREGATTSAGIAPEPSGRPRFSRLNKHSVQLVSRSEFVQTTHAHYNTIIFPDDREPLIRRLSARKRGILAEIVSAAIERARDSDPFLREDRKKIDEERKATYERRSKLIKSTVQFESVPNATAEDHLIGIANIIGYKNIHSLGKMNGQAILSVANNELAQKLIDGGFKVKDITVFPCPLFKPSNKYILSGVLAFIQDQDLKVALEPYGQMISSRPLPFPTDNPLLKHLSSLRREIVFKNKEKTPMPATLNVPYMDKSFTIFIGEDVVGNRCRRHGHVKNKYPFDPNIRATVTRTFAEVLNTSMSPVLPSETPKEARETTLRPSETPSKKRPLTASSGEENCLKEKKKRPRKETKRMPGHRKRRQFKQTDAFTRGMVIGLKRAGWSIRQIAADTHLGASTVHRLWRRWLEQGTVAIYRNAGATRVTSARVDRHESRFCLSSDSRHVRVWRRRGERSNPAATVERPTVRQRGIMVWGAIAYDSRSPLLRIQGTMTAQRYVDDVLRPVTLPYLQGVPNALYQQDNARPHTARISQQALQDVQMLPWPPYSPDLSPIEHVWDIIGRRLHALPQPRSEDELWQMVEREWRAIPQDAIRTLIDSLPRRVAACIAVRERADHEPGRLSSDLKPVPSSRRKIEHRREKFNHVNLTAGKMHADFAAVNGGDVRPSTSGAVDVAEGWAVRVEAAEAGDDGYTVVRNKRRRRKSPSRAVELRSSCIRASGNTGATPPRHTPAGKTMLVKEIRAMGRHHRRQGTAVFFLGRTLRLRGALPGLRAHPVPAGSVRAGRTSGGPPASESNLARARVSGAAPGVVTATLPWVSPAPPHPSGSLAAASPPSLRCPPATTSTVPPGFGYEEMGSLHPRSLPRRPSQSGQLPGALFHHAPPARLPPGDHVISLLQARLARFIWGPDRTALLPAGLVTRPVSLGGLVLLNVGAHPGWHASRASRSRRTEAATPSQFFRTTHPRAP
ncbi:hypothetical protein LAZ67_2003377, partial [Cordylochernes scorpioides]